MAPARLIRFNLFPWVRRPGSGPAAWAGGPILLAFAAVCACDARAQELEPRSYSNSPVGLNFLLAGYAYTEGSVSFDPSVPLTDADLRTNTAVFAYARALDAWGHAAKFDVIVPYTSLEGSALFEGQPLRREVSGLGDPRFRYAFIFHGAPALSAEAFASYRQDWIVGGSLQVSAPLGQYDHSRLVNIGTNRWAIRPELGISKAWGPWILEIAPSVLFYTDNDDFLDGGRVEQAPLYAVQAHLVYGFPSGIWAAVDAIYYTGGRTTVNGVEGDNLQRNTRVGLTVALPVDRNSALKLYASTGTSARTGNNFDGFGVVWQYRWGGWL